MLGSDQETQEILIQQNFVKKERKKATALYLK